jgi:hypothetical protein
MLSHFRSVPELTLIDSPKSTLTGYDLRIIASTLTGYDLRIIAYDDAPNDYPEEVWNDIRQYPFLQYMVGENEDMGISLGRNLALKLVQTKYFLLVDDDHVFNDKSNLEKVYSTLLMLT